MCRPLSTPPPSLPSPSPSPPPCRQDPCVRDLLARILPDIQSGALVPRAAAELLSGYHSMYMS